MTPEMDPPIPTGPDNSPPELPRDGSWARGLPWDGGRAILFFIFAALVSILAGILLQESLGFYISVLASELIVFGLIPFALSRIFDTGWMEWMRKPVLGAPFWLWAISGVVAFAVVQSNLPVLFDRLVPIPKLQLEFLRRHLTADNPLDWLLVFTVGALVPGVCEEITFRGLIQTGLRRSYGPRHAVVWTGFLFAMLHLNPWNFLGLWFFGSFLGYLTERTGSVIPAIILHLLNNTFALIVFSLQTEETWASPPEFIPWYYTIIGGVVLVFALWRLHRLGEITSSQPPGLSADIPDQTGRSRELSA